MLPWTCLGPKMKEKCGTMISSKGKVGEMMENSKTQVDVGKARLGMKTKTMIKSRPERGARLALLCMKKY